MPFLKTAGVTFSLCPLNRTGCHYSNQFPWTYNSQWCKWTNSPYLFLFSCSSATRGDTSNFCLLWKHQPQNKLQHSVCGEGCEGLVKCWMEAARSDCPLSCPKVTAPWGFTKAWVPQTHLSDGTGTGGLSRGAIEGGRTCSPVCCVLGWSPPCQSPLNPTLSQDGIFPEQKSYFGYVKVQYKGLFKKRGLETLQLQQLWLSCKWQAQCPWAIWRWILKQFKMPNWYAGHHIKMPFPFIRFHCRQGWDLFSVFLTNDSLGKWKFFPPVKNFQAWIGSQIAIILLTSYLQYCASPNKLSGSDLQ